MRPRAATAGRSGGDPETDPARDRKADGPRGTAVAWRRPALGLVLVALAFTVVQIAGTSLRMPLGWDEVVYSSQSSAQAPATYFDAPRARGISLLAAPVAAMTASTAALRAWMSLLAAVGLVISFWPWRRLAGEAVAVLAAACFASLWIVQFYADEVMPNLYVAYGSVAAVGWFLRSVGTARGGRRPTGALVASAVSIGFTALVRPSDAVFLAFPLVAGGLAVRARRGPAVAGSLIGGLAAGLLPWIVEAYARFGGPLARLRESSAAQGGMGWHVAIGMELRSLNGPLLCAPCDKPWANPALSLWWFATPVLACAGVLLAVRTRRSEPGRLSVLALPAVCALVVSSQYLFLLDYAAPRFLMPVYALAAIPVAGFLADSARAVPARWRPAVATLMAVLFTAHLAGQFLVLHRRAADQTRARGELLQLADHLTRAGLRPPCSLLGSDPVQPAYYAGCSSQPPAGPSATSAPPVREAIAETGNQGAPRDASGWRQCSFVLDDGSIWHVYLAPSPGTRWHC